MRTFNKNRDKPTNALNCAAMLQADSCHAMRLSPVDAATGETGTLASFGNGRAL